MEPHFHHHHHRVRHHHPIPLTHVPLLHLCRCCYRPLSLSPLHHRHLHQHQHAGSLHFPQLPPCEFSSQPLQNPCPVPAGLEKVESCQVPEAATGLQHQELNEVEEPEEEGGEEEDVFVLTDEWMEFFANSEAKRRLAKKKKKKGTK